MENLEIGYLADNQQFLPDLALWLHRQWDHLHPGATLETRTNRLKSYLNKRTVPVAFVAIRDGKPVGTASLIASDMTTRPELTPWLASVYVHPEARRCGVGRALVERVMREVKDIGIGRFYLWTDTQERLYASIGWVLEERVQYKGMLVSLMHYDTAAQG